MPKPDGRQCPDCVSEGKESCLRVVDMFQVTALPSDAFYDRQGVSHAHDPNIKCFEWHCSEGHRWLESSIIPCHAEECEFNDRPLHWTGDHLARPENAAKI